MTKDVCLLLYDVSAEAQAELARLAPDLEIVQGSRGVIPDDAVLRRVKVVYSHESKVMTRLLTLPEAKPDWIQLRTAGYDFLDVAAIRAKHVTVTNVRGIHGIQIAETLFGVLLGRARALFEAARNQERAVWNNDYRYEELSGRSLTIIGAGAIGTHVADLAAAFGMRVTGVSRSGQPTDTFPVMYKTADWRTAVRDADIVLNLLPLNDETDHFFNAEAFAAMKSGVWFVNFGRGGTVDTEALLAALDNGRVEFAALDVFEEEPLPADSPLWQRDDMMLTPHIGGLTVFYEERAFAVFKENLAAYAKTGKPSLNVITLS